MTTEQTLGIIGAVVAVLGIVVTGIDFLIRKWLQKHRDELIISLNQQIATLTTSIQQATRERDDARSQRDTALNNLTTTSAALATATGEDLTLSNQLHERGEELTELKETKVALDKHQKTHDNRIRRALKLEGAIWTQPVMADTPQFRPLAERRTPIISVLNLKGGVGKTTLTAYLAWALSNRGYRVLLVDLDLQGSLSSLFLRNDELARLGKAESLLQHFLNGVTKSDNERPKRKLLDFAVPVPQLNKHSRLVAASDKLAYAELSQSVRWLL